MAIPQLPVPHKGLIPYLASSKLAVSEAMRPYRDFEAALRELYAQDRQNPLLEEPNLNLVQVFDGHEDKFRIRARDLANEAPDIKNKYMLQLAAKDRLADGALAITPMLRDFKKNFNVFSESALVDLDWSNVVVSGSAAVTALLPVPDEHNKSKRQLRQYYHEQLAPASDVDMFLYGLDEEGAKKKIEQIEQCIRDTILYPVTTVRTKYAITIVSQYPCRHIQVVLRLYKDISEILTSFDVDSACVAYDGSQVYATPRAIAAFMTQTNPTDLSRRSPSYENRLSKYSRRGFEVYCPTLDRSRVDPTIFERSFGRVLGLARLLVLEKLPSPSDRDDYIAKRRGERGRPEIAWNLRSSAQGRFGNIKDEQPDEVAEWVDEEDVSNYSTFTVPYGPRFNAKKIERLVFTKDLLLNAEWNKPRDRTVHLHRHPAFFGTSKDVFADCCESCPDPSNDEEELVAKKEAEIYIRGPVGFVADNPGRQQIGSFNPLTEDDWTEMAYIGNVQSLCQAIVDGDIDHVRDWCSNKESDVNRRDHTGRTPLHLAVQSSTPDIVQCLIDAGARITARLVDGKTALHLAAQRGNTMMLEALIKKSEENEEQEEERHDQRLKKLRAEHGNAKLEDQLTSDKPKSEQSEEEDELLVEDEDDHENEEDDMTQGSFVRVTSDKEDEDNIEDDGAPDYYDANVIAWDYSMSPLHMAIIAGHVDVVRVLLDSFGADVLLPVKIKDAYQQDPKAAILTLSLAANFSPNTSEMTRELLRHGASSSQADMHEISALHYVVDSQDQTVLDLLLEYDGPAARAAINHVSVRGHRYNLPHVSTSLLTAIQRKDEAMVRSLLKNGASVAVSVDAFISSYQRNVEQATKDPAMMRKLYQNAVEQPLVKAILNDEPEIARLLIEHGADINTLNGDALVSLMSDRTWPIQQPNEDLIGSVLDLVRARKQRSEEYLEDKSEPLPEVEELGPDTQYLDGLNKQSYEYWAARTDLERARGVVEVMKKDRKDALQGRVRDRDSKKDNIERAKEILAGFESLQELLENRGALTFAQLHPEYEKNSNPNGYSHHRYYNQKRRIEGPFQTNFSLNIPDLSDIIRAAYLALFEAAWSGDADRVKALTLSEWEPQLIGQSGNVGDTFPPLRVTQADSRAYTPFVIALVRGHLELADIILDIAMVQYSPDKNHRKYRYSLQNPEADSISDISGDEHSDDEDDDDVNVYKHLIDQKYTVESVAALQNTVESKVTPLQLFSFQAELYRMMGSKSEAKEYGIAIPEDNLFTEYNVEFDKYSQGHVCAVLSSYMKPHSDLFQFAIAKNNLPLLKWLLEREERYRQREEGVEDDRPHERNINERHFRICMQLGRTEMLGEIIRQTGMSLPAKKLAEKSGVEVKEKPKYYQGLNVYGKKRKDWADRSRGIVAHQQAASDTAPLLEAATSSNVETLEYFLSDTPLRRYEEYAASRPDDAAIEALRQEKGGISKAIATWLNSRSQLAMHGAVMAEPKGNATPRSLELLINAMPHAIDGLNCARLTPLQVAFKYQRLSAARALIRAGANQAARDRNGYNILHHLMTNLGSHIQGYHNSNGDPIFLVPAFEVLVNLIDPTLLQDLLLQRSTQETGSHTPLSLLLHENAGSKTPDLIKAISRRSQGKDFEIMDAAGDYPLHFVLRHSMVWAAEAMVEFKPALLFRENAVGLTPIEICDIAGLHHIVKNPPSLQHQHSVNLQSQLSLHVGRISAKKQSDYDKCAQLCREAVQEHAAPRKLVSLFDANEVARRLAEQHKHVKHRTPRAITSAQGRSYDWNQAGDKAATDEVNKWSDAARDSHPADLMHYLQAHLRGEAVPS